MNLNAMCEKQHIYKYGNTTIHLKCTIVISFFFLFFLLSILRRLINVPFNSYFFSYFAPFAHSLVRRYKIKENVK